MNAQARNLQRRIRLNLRETEREGRSLLRLSGLSGAELSILFVGESRMRRLNLEHRGKDRPTDVLSFPQFENIREIEKAEGEFLLGDIVICPAVAEKNARLYGAALKEELRRLLVHGFVHLLGYDHERGRAEEKRMRRKEAEFLGAL